jgi:hypothetical protein
MEGTDVGELVGAVGAQEIVGVVVEGAAVGLSLIEGATVGASEGAVVGGVVGCPEGGLVGAIRTKSAVMRTGVLFEVVQALRNFTVALPDDGIVMVAD